MEGFLNHRKINYHGCLGLLLYKNIYLQDHNSCPEKNAFDGRLAISLNFFSPNFWE